MEYGERNNGGEDLDMRMAMTAHHEAGHIVVAARCGIRLRPEGIMLDSEAAGLACYCKEPEDSDVSRERIIVSTFAGHIAQQRLCKERSYPLRGYMEIILSPDWKEARGMITKLSGAYWSGRSADGVQQALESRSEVAVERNWNVIQAVGKALLAKDWEPVKTLQSRSRWSTQVEAKYVIREEVVRILSQHGIPACVSEC
jgi:hypothetical protein